MIDREKVIETFKERICTCSMIGDGFDVTINWRLADDILALLKEQEAVKPKSKTRHGANAQIQHFCGNCNSMLHGKPKFCSECGKGVLW